MWLVQESKVIYMEVINAPQFYGPVCAFIGWAPAQS